MTFDLHIGRNRRRAPESTLSSRRGATACAQSIGLLRRRPQHQVFAATALSLAGGGASAQRRAACPNAAERGARAASTLSPVNLAPPAPSGYTPACDD